MNNIDSYYQPTEKDLKDWYMHCLMLAAEEMEEQEEYFDGEEDEEEAEDYLYGPDNFLDDAEILRDAGMGTDEDYGFFGSLEDW